MFNKSMVDLGDRYLNILNGIKLSCALDLLPLWAGCWNRHKHGITSLITSVYRKPTHTDLYLQWDSHHHLAAKFSVINTLKHRVETVCSNNQLLKEEDDHLGIALKRCKDPVWALNRADIKQKNTNWPNQDSNIRNNTGLNNNKPYMVVTYVKGMSESCKNICRKHGIEVHFKGDCTIKDLLADPRDRDTILQ